MTRNDTFFKILFAIEIALIPLAMASYLLMPKWTVGLFIAGLLVAKIWVELFKSKSNKMHKLLVAIGNILTIASLVIFFTIYNYIHLAMCIVVVVLVVLMNVFKLIVSDVMPEMIDAVDSCYMLFECLTLGTLAFVVFYQLATNIALFALILTAIVSVAYRLYYLMRYKGGMDKIKGLFRRK